MYIPFHSSPEQRDVSNLFIMGLLLMIPGASYEILLFMRSLRRLSLICTEVDFLLLSIKNSSTALSSPVIPLHINSISFRLWDTEVKIFKYSKHDQFFAKCKLIVLYIKCNSNTFNLNDSGLPCEFLHGLIVNFKPQRPISTK